ncbi:hypothetical protein MHBO_001327 [Bonamia ostreae]|uniref:Uncharacterized protein n=1 Tax=Bonamia ostreae TaxID=126728 RepID=A0ABV2AJG5_9EUKA
MRMFEFLLSIEKETPIIPINLITNDEYQKTLFTKIDEEKDEFDFFKEYKLSDFSNYFLTINEYKDLSEIFDIEINENNSEKIKREFVERLRAKYYKK